MKKGTSENIGSQSSSSSHSDGIESEPIVKSCLSAQRNFNRHSFISKPIHPLSFPSDTPTREDIYSAIVALLENGSTPLRDIHRRSSVSSNIDFADISDSFETEISGQAGALSDGCRCDLCERFLSQRSPWSSRRIVRSGDMPTIGVLSCCHVFHAECLERTTPKNFDSDPPCPLCVKLEESSPDQHGVMSLRGGFPRLRPFSEEGPSRPWRCRQVGDCVEGALHAPSRNALLLLKRDHVKKNLCMKGNSSKELPGKLKKIVSYSSQPLAGRAVDKGAPADPSMSR